VKLSSARTTSGTVEVAAAEDEESIEAVGAEHYRRDYNEHRPPRALQVQPPDGRDQPAERD
jgi:hypothetical protein